MQKHIIKGHAQEHRQALLNQVGVILAEIACSTLEPEVGAPIPQSDQDALAREMGRVLDQRIPYLVNLHHAAS